MKRSVHLGILAIAWSMALGVAFGLAQTKATQKAGETKAAAKKETGAEKTKAAPAAKKETAPGAAKKKAEPIDVNSASKQELMALQAAKPAKK